ncbi:Hypothetical predicted protein [Cloeon dipterum]|uniref:C-type lectin domain-containing protein n=1 Tax=Cloeon dipterum TaxID=197152 RepID=A0A8S1DV00_9INSE|nr:Hypothetical predicted protein [Cloeon dipterum]
MKVLAFLLAALAAASANDAILAELGLIPFNGGQYLLSSFNASWVDASNFCKSIGFALVDIDTEEDHVTVTDVFGAAIPDRVWIGGTDLGREGSFYWGQSLRDFSPNETYWHEGEPSGTSLHGIKEDCVQYRRLVNDTEVLWNDAPCELKYQFICEVVPAPCA